MPQTSETTDEISDLLIIGGGINGVGIARDAAGRGHKVVLVEQADLAGATSSSSTKLIHGGLRYLESFDFRLVREALIERERLLAMAPHIIHPMQFVLPHVAGLRPRWEIRLGLLLYDHIGGRKRLPASRGVRLNASGLGRALRPGIEHGFVYSDCSVDDARLVVLNAMDAAQRGASIRTRTKFLGATLDNGRWRAELQREDTRVRTTVSARAIVNAAGPWVEDVLRHVPGSHNRTQIRLVKGSHIVVPRLYDGRHAFLLQHPDGRVVFTIPYQDQFTLIGTTDVPYHGDPATVAIDAEETSYLCETVNRYFAQPITPTDVRWSYAGVRPLTDDDAASASKVSRDYKLELTEAAAQPALLTVFGGKITTYRRLAELALQKLQPFIGGAKQGWTDQATLPGGDLPRADFEAFLVGVRQRWPLLPESLTRRLALAYGTRISDIIGAARSIDDLGTQFGAGLTQAELDYLRTHEWARTAEDVLWRRSKLGLLMSTAEQTALASHLGQTRHEATAPAAQDQ